MTNATKNFQLLHVRPNLVMDLSSFTAGVSRRTISSHPHLPKKQQTMEQVGIAKHSSLIATTTGEHGVARISDNLGNIVCVEETHHTQRIRHQTPIPSLLAAPAWLCLILPMVWGQPRGTIGQSPYSSPNDLLGAQTPENPMGLLNFVVRMRNLKRAELRRCGSLRQRATEHAVVPLGHPKLVHPLRFRTRSV
jgi:hypothetical protein